MLMPFLVTFWYGFCLLLKSMVTYTSLVLTSTSINLPLRNSILFTCSTLSTKEVRLVMNQFNGANFIPLIYYFESIFSCSRIRGTSNGDRKSSSTNTRTFKYQLITRYEDSAWIPSIKSYECARHYIKIFWTLLNIQHKLKREF